jgi:hypothetical protein
MNSVRDDLVPGVQVRVRRTEHGHSPHFSRGKFVRFMGDERGEVFFYSHKGTDVVDTDRVHLWVSRETEALDKADAPYVVIGERGQVWTGKTFHHSLEQARTYEHRRDAKRASNFAARRTNEVKSVRVLPLADADGVIADLVTRPYPHAVEPVATAAAEIATVSDTDILRDVQHAVEAVLEARKVRDRAAADLKAAGAMVAEAEVAWDALKGRV